MPAINVAIRFVMLRWNDFKVCLAGLKVGTVVLFVFQFCLKLQLYLRPMGRACSFLWLW